MSKLQKPKMPMLSASFAVVFSGVLIAICLRDDPSVTAVVVLGVLVLFCLLATVLDISRFDEFKANLVKGELSFKATPEDVEQTLKATADQEKIDSKDGGKAAPSLTPLVEDAKHKDRTERTDADYLTLATDAWRAKDIGQASHFAYAGLDRPPSDKRITAALYSRLGTIEHDLKHPEQAERHYRRAIGIDSGFAVAHSNLGTLLSEMDRSEEAEAAYREAIRLDPGFASAHINLGALLSEMDRSEEAEAAFREALRLDPGFAGVHNNLGLLLSPDRPEEAEAAYREALRLDPGHAYAHNNLGILLSKTGRPEEAEASYREALRLDPGYANAQHNLDLLLRKMKK